MNNTHYIAGYNTKTIYKVFSVMNIWMNYTNSDDVFGDSVVPVWSVTLGDRQANRTIYAKNVDHRSLVSNADCLEYISRLIGEDYAIPEDSILSQEMIFDD